MSLRILLGVAVAAVCLSAAPLSASADRSEAVKLLVTVGELRPPQAKKVVQRVSSMMAKSAGSFADDKDPLRVAVSRALFGSDVPTSQTEKAKVRLRLFSGLTRWSIGALFSPQGREVLACRDLGLHPKACEALVSVGEHVAPDAPRVASRRPAKAEEPPSVPSLGRFNKYDSGFRQNAGGQQKAAGSSPGQLSARSGVPARAAKPKAPAANSAAMTSTKAAYLARRQAYLDRQKARADAAKAVRTQELKDSRVERGAVGAELLVEVDDSGNAVSGNAVSGDSGGGPAPAAKKAPEKKPAAAPAAASSGGGDDDDLGGLVDDLLAN